MGMAIGLLVPHLHLTKPPPTVEATVRQLCRFLPRPALCLPWTLLPGKSSLCSYLEGPTEKTCLQMSAHGTSFEQFVVFRS